MPDTRDTYRRLGEARKSQVYPKTSENDTFEDRLLSRQTGLSA